MEPISLLWAVLAGVARKVGELFVDQISEGKKTRQEPTPQPRYTPQEYQFPQPQPQSTIREPQYKKTTRGANIAAGFIALSCVIIVGVWVFYQYFDRSSPQTLVKGFFNSISIGMYESALDRMEPKSRKRLFPKGVDDFRAKWEMRKNVKIQSVSIDKEAGNEATVNAFITWSSVNSDAPFDVDVKCAVARSAKDADWIILSCDEYPRYAAPPQRSK